MPIYGILPIKRDLPGYRYKIVFRDETGPSSYPTGGFDVVVDELQSVEFVSVTAEGQYFAKATVSGNTVKITVYDTSGEITNGADLSSVHFKIVAVGA